MISRIEIRRRRRLLRYDPPRNAGKRNTWGAVDCPRAGQNNRVRPSNIGGRTTYVVEMANGPPGPDSICPEQLINVPGATALLEGSD